MPWYGQVCSARSIASCTVSSARPTCAGPRSRVRRATMRPDGWRKRCSTSCSGFESRTPNAESRSRSIKLPDLDRAAVLEVRMIERALHGFIVVGGFDRVEAAEHFLRLAVRAVGRARLAALGSNDFAGVLRQPLAVARERLLRPRHVFLDRFLHFLGAEFLPVLRVVVEQEHELRHVSLQRRVRLSYSNEFRRLGHLRAAVLVRTIPARTRGRILMEPPFVLETNKPAGYRQGRG